MKWIRIIASMLLACLLVCGAALAQEEERVVEKSTLAADVPVKGASVQIFGTRIDGEEWLFLPAFADVEAMALSVEGQRATWENAALEDGVWMGEVRSGDEALFELHVMRSENLRALFLFSDDPAEHGRQYIESSERHEDRATGSMGIVNVDGTVDHADVLLQLRGRGNSTWDMQKKPYQFKLAKRADLLKTGDPSESNRTWTLLADAFDATYLHNRIALDMGLEMGMENTSHSEHVDLYYDGEYRGLYLLCEKVEAGEGRLGAEDADKNIQQINAHAGITDLESLPVSYEEHPLGSGYYTYVEGMVEPEDPGFVTYILEMEGENTTLSDQCWFHLSDTSVIASKNPKNASQSMMLYISTRLEEAIQTLLNGGVNPQNGRTIQDDFDVEAFARILLVNEFFHNADSYTYSSSWFILPSGETRFQPGTLWDFDLGMRYCRDGLDDRGVGLRAMKDWPLAFYGCDAFVDAMQRIYREEIAPVAERILLGTEEGVYLKPLDVYARQIDASRRMNEKIWPRETYDEFRYAQDFESEIEELRTFLTQRHAWLKRELEAVSPYAADSITLWGNAEYGHVDSDLHLYAAPGAMCRF